MNTFSAFQCFVKGGCFVNMEAFPRHALLSHQVDKAISIQIHHFLHHGFSHGSPKKEDDGIITVVTFIWLLPNMVDQGSWRPPCTGDHQRQRGSSNRSADRINILEFMMIYDCKCRTRKRGGGEAVATGA